MVAVAPDESIHSFHIQKDTLVAAPIEIAYEAVLEELGPGSELPGGQPFPMKIEPWPGGRWFRDLGNNAGHLWGHVQVIKPPALIELCGPMFMSYAAISHVQYRLTTEGSDTRIKITHRAIGQIPADHRTGVHEGWSHTLQRIAELAAKRMAARK